MIIEDEPIRKYNEKNEVDAKTLIKPFIFVLVTKGAKDEPEVIYSNKRKNIDGSLKKGTVKKYKWHPESNEYRASFTWYSKKYHRITLPDLLSGTDAYGNKISWFEKKDEAELYLGLIYLLEYENH